MDTVFGGVAVWRCRTVQKGRFTKRAKAKQRWIDRESTVSTSGEGRRDFIQREKRGVSPFQRGNKRGGGGNVVHIASPVDWMGSQIKPHAAHTLLRLPHFFGAGLLLYDSLCRNISDGLWAPGASFGALNG